MQKEAREVAGQLGARLRAHPCGFKRHHDKALRPCYPFWKVSRQESYAWIFRSASTRSACGMFPLIPNASTVLRLCMSRSSLW